MHVNVDRGLRGPNSITWRALFLLLLVVTIDTTAHLTLKAGMERAKDMFMPGALPFPVHNAVLAGILKAALEPKVWVATAMIMFSFLIWSRALTLVDLSVAVPVVSLNLATVPLGASLILGEVIEPKRLIGILLIVIGVLICSLTRYKTPDHHSLGEPGFEPKPLHPH
ncbi:MAG: EamA family transporter [Verrucomicrobiales bacterium]